jgi:hypothetical protein
MVSLISRTKSIPYDPTDMVKNKDTTSWQGEDSSVTKYLNNTTSINLVEMDIKKDFISARKHSTSHLCVLVFKQIGLVFYFMDS